MSGPFPTSADLAAFRRSIAYHHKETTPLWDLSTGTAFASELRDGIGNGGHPERSRVVLTCHSIARLSAASLRAYWFASFRDAATREPWHPIAEMPDPNHPVIRAIDTFTPLAGYLNNSHLASRLDYPEVMAQ